MRPDSDQTRKFLRAVMPPGTCIEMRIFRANFGRNGFIEPSDRYTATYSGWYDNADSLIVDASRAKGVSVYVTFNPVNPALLSRSDNKLIRSKTATTDTDIIAIRWLYIDIDPERPADISSTAEEFAAAIATRDRILSENPSLAASSIWGTSGNGSWILVRLPDYPNNEEAKSLIARGLDYLSSRYSDDQVKIDTKTKNAARVMCLPGTFKTKGSNRPERPWRQVGIECGGDDA